MSKMLFSTLQTKLKVKFNNMYFLSGVGEQPGDGDTQSAAEAGEERQRDSEAGQGDPQAQGGACHSVKVLSWSSSAQSVLQQATHLMASGQDSLLSNVQVTHTSTCTWTVSSACPCPG